MTIRDLTPTQVYNLRRKCAKEFKRHRKETEILSTGDLWDRAFAQGVKQTLALLPDQLNAQTRPPRS